MEHDRDIRWVLRPGAEVELAERGFVMAYTVTEGCATFETTCLRCGWNSWTGGDPEGAAPLVGEAIENHERHCPALEADGEETDHAQASR